MSIIAWATIAMSSICCTAAGRGANRLARFLLLLRLSGERSWLITRACYMWYNAPRHPGRPGGSNGRRGLCPGRKCDIIGKLERELCRLAQAERARQRSPPNGARLMRTKLATLIAYGREGFGVPGAIPTTHNNPGDLRHSPHSTHPPGQPNTIGQIDTVEHGWEDLERQLRLFASRNMTLRDMVYSYAPKADGNDPAGYLAFICTGLGVDPDCYVADALLQLADPPPPRAEKDLATGADPPSPLAKKDLPTDTDLPTSPLATIMRGGS